MFNSNQFLKVESEYRRSQMKELYQQSNTTSSKPISLKNLITLFKKKEERNVTCCCANETSYAC